MLAQGDGDADQQEGARGAAGGGGPHSSTIASQVGRCRAVPPAWAWWWVVRMAVGDMHRRGWAVTLVPLPQSPPVM